MNLIYFKAQKGNFGDDLNPFIFNRIFSCLTNSDHADIDFYGIGTLIDRRIDQTRHSVFWGTGIRDITQRYDQKNWEIFFLRGPISANFLQARYITDAAYSILLLDDISFYTEKEYEISVVPHYRHMETVNWNYIGNLLGIHMIDPRDPPEIVIGEIAKSKKVIASAMHGAIMADICRVPWVRLRMEIIPAESFFISDLKWNDWLLSMSLKDRFIPIRNYQIGIDGKSTAISHYELIYTLKQRLNENIFQLSSDTMLKAKIKQIAEEVGIFKDRFCK